MFEIAKAKSSKSKGEKKVLRKLNELLAKIIILHFINHVFNEENLINDFKMYICWNDGKRNLDNLEGWINSEKVSILRQFFKDIIAKYQ